MRFMSGKALFTYNPELFEDAEGAVDEAEYESDYSGGEETKQTNGKYDPNNIEEEKEERVNGNLHEREDIHDQEELKEEFKIDKNLFQDDGGDLNEEVDFDDDEP